MRRAIFGIGAVAAGLAFAAPAHADPDTDFTSDLRSYGISGPKDYNAWIGRDHLRAQQRRRSGGAVDGLHLRAACFTESLKRGGHDFRSALAFAATAWAYSLPAAGIDAA
jgi:hypothetical protein